MKKVLILLFTLASLASYAQPQSLGEIRGRSRTGSVKAVGVDSLSPNRNALLVTDSVLVALTRLMKTNDSVAKNILNEMYVLWRENITSTDNKVGTRDTILQDVYSSGKLKVQDDSTFSRSTVKISTLPTVTATVDSTIASRRGVVLLTNPTLTNDSTTMSRRNVQVTNTVTTSLDSSSQRRGVVLLQNPTIANTSFGISGTLPAFASTPTVNVGTGGYSVLAADSTKYRKVVSVDNQFDSLTASRRGVVLLTNPTITNDSSSMSRTTVKISTMPNVTVNNIQLLDSIKKYDSLNYTAANSINNKIPSGLDVVTSSYGDVLRVFDGANADETAFLNVQLQLINDKLNDSIRVFATNGFGSGSTSLDATDSTNLARAGDSTISSRRGVVLLQNPTITNTSFAAT